MFYATVRCEEDHHGVCYGQASLSWVETDVPLVLAPSLEPASLCTFRSRLDLLKPTRRYERQPFLILSVSVCLLLMSDLVSNHKYQRWGNSDVQPCSQPQRCVLREHIFTPGSWFKNKTNMKCKRLLTFTQYLSAGQNRQNLIWVSEVRTCLLIMVENVPCFQSSSQTAAPMCWDVPGISFFFQFRSYSRHVANGFVPHPLYVSHTGVVDAFVVSPPPLDICLILLSVESVQTYQSYQVSDSTYGCQGLHKM